MVVEFPSFCCGLSLKRGTVIIGILQSILSFIFMILCAAYAENPHELIAMSDTSIVPDLHTLRCLLIIVATASAMQCVFSIFIIFGAETNRPLLLLPWLIFNPISIFVYIIATITGMIEHSGISNTSFIVGHLIVGISVCLIGGYNIVTVHRLYKHLKSLNF